MVSKSCQTILHLSFPGFQTLVLNLLAVPGLLAHGVSLALVTDKYGLLMTSSILLSLLLASVVYYMARFTRDSRQEFTNPLSDLYHGLALHPRLPSVLGGAALKLQLFRLFPAHLTSSV